MTTVEITMDMIKKLRARTGIGVNKCKEALRESNGDIEVAIDNLRKSGMASAVKKEGRETSEGLVATAETGDAVAIVEVNAETDFVVRNENFQKFAHEIATEVAKSAPASLEAFLAQPSPTESGMTIDEHRAATIQSLGENIQISRFERWEKGGNSSVGLYSHMGGKIVTAVEIEGSSDVADLARDVAMHAAAENPEYLSPETVPADVIAHEREIAAEQVKGKPENIMEKILDGKVQAYYKQVCLTLQPFVKDPSMSVTQVIEKAGKGLTIKRFLRWEIGG